MKKINFETIKKIDYVLVLLIAIVCIITFLVEKISRYMPKHHSEPAHISVVNSNDDISSEETKESLDFLEKLEDVYIFTVSTKAIKSDELSYSEYDGLEISNAIGQSIRQSSSQIINFSFLKGKEEYNLFSSKDYIYKYELKNSKEIDFSPSVYESYIPSYSDGHDFNIYAVIKEDTNNDKKLDSKDNISLYISDYDGKKGSSPKSVGKA